MKAYDKYKDSGVEWLGEIPEHWEVRKLKNMMKFSKGLTITKDNLREEGVWCVNYGEVHSKYGFEVDPTIHSLKCVSADYLKEHSTSLLDEGDFIFADTSEDIEGSGNFTYLNSNKKVFAGYHTVIGRRSTQFLSRFLAYEFDSFRFRGQIRSKVKGVKVYSITQVLLKNQYVWLPPISEQKAIVTFLDEKCGKIDEAISIKEKQIALLKEHRQIIIQEAVTKGLDKNVKLKDSDVDWIGEIPEHWEVKRLKYIFNKIQTGSTPSTTNLKYFGGDVNWFNPKDLNVEMLNYSEKKLSKAALVANQVKLFEGDSILIVGIGATAGKTSYLNEKATFNQQITGFKSMQNNNKFYFFLFKNLSQVFLSLAQFTTLPILNNEFFKKVLLPLPSKIEQQQIVDYLEAQTSKIDKAIGLKTEQVEKLKLYKQSLINEVVTGKVQV